MKDGNWKWILSLGKVIEYDSEGKPLRMLGTHTDITERKQAEERFVSAFHSSPMPITITRVRDGKIVDVNDAWCEVFGYTREQAVGQTSVELGVTDEKTRQQVMNMLKTTGLIRNLEARITTRSGEERDMLYSMEILEIEGEPHSLATLIDITKRKQAEKAMRESEERFRLLFENNHTVMMLIEPVSGAIRNANVAASEFYGYSLSELCAMNVNDINQMTPDEVLAERMRALTEERNFFNFQHRLANGEIRSVEVHSAPIEMKGRSLLFSIVYDTTERKRTEDALRNSQAQMTGIFNSAMDKRSFRSTRINVF